MARAPLLDEPAVVKIVEPIPRCPPRYAEYIGNVSRAHGRLIRRHEYSEYL